MKPWILIGSLLLPSLLWAEDYQWLKEEQLAVQQEQADSLHEIARAERQRTRQDMINGDGAGENCPIQANPLDSGKCHMIDRKDFPGLPEITDAEGNVLQKLFLCPTKWTASNE